MRAHDVMTSPVVTVELETPIQDIARRLLENRISGAPVLDPDGKVVGIVSEGDLVHRAEIGAQRQPSWWLVLLGGREHRLRDYIRRRGDKARDVMSQPVIAVQEGTPIAKIADLLEKHRIKRVPVVRDGRVVGIVSRADLVRALAAMEARLPEPPQDDRELRRSILAGLAEVRQPTSLVNVVVHQGRAQLWGAVASDQEREAIRIAVEKAVPPERVENNVLVLPNVVQAAQQYD